MPDAPRSQPLTASHHPADAPRIPGAADEFALGVVLYELAIGRHPFPGGCEVEVLAAIQSRAPDPPRRVSAEVGPDLEALLLRLLEKDPARRPAAADAAQELARLAAAPVGRASPGPRPGPPGSPGVPPPPRRRPRWCAS
jgi:serine/threonine-protein kinase